MKATVCSIMLAGLTALAGAAHAQEAGSLPTPFTASAQERDTAGWTGDYWRGDPGLPAAFTGQVHPGVAAIEANNFAQAETLFAKSLRFNKNDLDLRFHMGMVKMELGKWDEARHYLRTPARELRKDPKPKSLLGVTYARLGDVASANAQRDALLKMAAACNGTCETSAEIANGIQMIDSALAEAGLL